MKRVVGGQKYEIVYGIWRLLGEKLYHEVALLRMKYCRVALVGVDLHRRWGAEKLCHVIPPRSASLSLNQCSMKGYRAPRHHVEVIVCTIPDPFVSSPPING